MTISTCLLQTETVRSKLYRSKRNPHTKHCFTLSYFSVCIVHNCKESKISSSLGNSKIKENGSLTWVESAPG